MVRNYIDHALPGQKEYLAPVSWCGKKKCKVKTSTYTVMSSIYIHHKKKKNQPISALLNLL